MQAFYILSIHPSILHLVQDSGAAIRQEATFTLDRITQHVSRLREKVRVLQQNPCRRRKKKLHKERTQLRSKAFLERGQSVNDYLTMQPEKLLSHIFIYVFC